MIDLDDAQAAAVRVLLGEPRPVIAVVGPAGAGKTRMLAAAVDAWHTAGIPVFGVGPSATAAKQLASGAGTVADTLHKLVHEHTNNHPPGAKWDLPAGSVVIIDEAAMVDTRLLHQYSQIAQARNWRTILVRDHRQLDAVDAGGMFAELVNHPDVVTVELDTLHRFDNAWEAAASLELRDDPDQHGPERSARDWTPQRAVTAALARQPDEVSALERQRQLRDFQSTPQQGNKEPSQKPIDDRDETARQRATDVASRLRHFTIRRSQGLTR